MRAYLLILSIAALAACNNTSTDEKEAENKIKLDAKTYADSAQKYWYLAVTEDSMMVDSALLMVDYAIAADTTNVMYKYVKASYLAQMGLYNQALDIYTGIDDKSMVDYGTYSIMGMLYYKLGQTELSDKYIQMSHESMLAKIAESESKEEIFHLKLLDAILLVMQNKKAEAIDMLENITPADETQAGYLNQQLLDLKSKTKDDLVEDMFPTDRKYMFERNKMPVGDSVVTIPSESNPL